MVWFVARAHAYLGRLAGHIDDYSQMVAEIQTGIEMLSKLDGKAQRRTEARFWSWLALAELKLEDVDQAINAYEQAIAIGQGPDIAGEDELNRWQAELDALTKGVE
jgi:tetratricopeptide (TPR) repeat protein